MKRVLTIVGVCCLIALLTLPMQIFSQACPKVMILSKNLSFANQADVKCDSCLQATYKVNKSEFTILIKWNPNTPCDETAAMIPAGSTLKVRVHRVVRIDKAGGCANVERGSFYNVGGWTLSDPAGTTLFTGDVYRGVVGVNPQSTTRCCNRQHEEVFIEGKGAAATTTGWYLRAMGVISEYFDLKTCKYSANWTGKLDGVLSQQ